LAIDALILLGREREARAAVLTCERDDPRSAHMQLWHALLEKATAPLKL
jgi:hypothetical protein